MGRASAGWENAKPYSTKNTTRGLYFGKTAGDVLSLFKMFLDDLAILADIVGNIVSLPVKVVQ